MQDSKTIIENAKAEIVFTTSRSGGSGGQHVNKVETKVTLRWSIANSEVLSEDQRKLLLEKLSNHINKSGELVIYHQTSRSQLTNKERAVKKWERLITKAFHVPKKRKTLKPSKKAIATKRKNKEHRSELKASRKKIVL